MTATETAQAHKSEDERKFGEWKCRCLECKAERERLRREAFARVQGKIDRMMGRV